MSLYDLRKLEEKYDDVFVSIANVINEKITKLDEANSFINSSVNHDKIKVCMSLKQSIINNDIEHFCFIFLSATMLLPHVIKLNNPEKGDKIGELLVSYYKTTS